MNRIESKMLDSDVAVIKKKVKSIKLFSLFLILFFSSFIAVINYLQLPYFTIQIAISILLIVLILVFIYFVSHKLVITENDLKMKIKIADELTIISKYNDRGSSKTLRYIIAFNSTDIPKYEVTRNVYNTINVNDLIAIEYSKSAMWILKIEHNGVSIENPRMIQ